VNYNRTVGRTDRSLRIRVPDPRRILVLRPGAIGDTLLTFPALTALRERFPTASIEVVGNRLALELARVAGLIDRVDAFGADWVSDLFGDEPAPALRDRLEEIDLGIVWSHSLAAASDLAARLKRAGVRAVLPATSFPEAGSRRHVADQLLGSLAPLGLSQTRRSIRIGLARSTDSEITPRPTIVLDFADRLVVLHPGAGGRRKRWPADRFAALADRLILAGYNIVLTAGPSDDDVAEVVRSLVRHGEVRILADRSLGELARIFGRTCLYVGNDSGITHLAALAGAPTLALFGPFDPVYWAPIGPLVSVVDAGLSCLHRADPREGCRACDLMPSLSIETVWDAAEALLRREVGVAGVRPSHFPTD
jgi:heptosyltransferase-3